MNSTNRCLSKPLGENINWRDLEINLISFDKIPENVMGNAQRLRIQKAKLLVIYVGTHWNLRRET